MRKALEILAAVVLVGGGAAALVMLAKGRPEAARATTRPAPTQVQVVAAERATGRVTVRELGTVVPARTVTLTPQVSGEVVRQSAALVPGGRLSKGDVVLRIDKKDYQLTVQQQRAQVSRAEMDLATEKARKAVAEQEWRLVGGDVKANAEGRALALRDIQVATAQAALASANSGLERARLSLARTTLRAPFTALVTEETVDRGQVVGPSSRIATLVDADLFRVRVAVPMDRLRWLRIPGFGGDEGSAVTVRQRAGGESLGTWPGRVVALQGELDPAGKMAQVLVEVPAPLDAPDGGLPLMLGARVEVAVEGPELKEALALPAQALRDGSSVWLLREGRLHVAEVEVLWRQDERVLVREGAGIVAGDAVVTSRLAAPVEGMALATADGRTGPKRYAELGAAATSEVTP